MRPVSKTSATIETRAALAGARAPRVSQLSCSQSADRSFRYATRILEQKRDCSQTKTYHTFILNARKFSVKRFSCCFVVVLMLRFQTASFQRITIIPVSLRRRNSATTAHKTPETLVRRRVA